MVGGAASLRIPLVLAGVWCITASFSTVAAPVALATVADWHDTRRFLAQLGLWQAWISIAACVGLLTLSRKKHSEIEEGWAQGALLIFVLGGVVTAVLLNYGVLPNWLARPASWLLRAQVLLLLCLHWCCGFFTLRHLLQFRNR